MNKPVSAPAEIDGNTGDDLDLESAFFVDTSVDDQDDAEDDEDDVEDQADDQDDQDDEDDEDDEAEDGDKDGDDEDDAEEKDDEDDEDDDVSGETYTVKVNGEEREVTLAQLVENFQKGEAFTQKTQAHAEEVRAFEKQRDADLGQLKQSLQYWALPTAREPVMEDYKDRPQDFMRDFGQWQQATQRQKAAGDLLAQIDQMEAAQTAQRESQLLLDAAPEWTDETVRSADFKRMTEFAESRYGVDPAEVLAIQDHRILLLLRDASKVAQIEAKPIITKRKTEKTPRMQPGTRRPVDDNGKKRKAAEARLAKGTANADDLVQAFFTD